MGWESVFVCVFVCVSGVRESRGMVPPRCRMPRGGMSGVVYTYVYICLFVSKEMQPGQFIPLTSEYVRLATAEL